jgi:HEAT repeat protein
MRNADVNVRRQGAAACVLRPTPARVTALARLLDDLHPALRGQVRDDLFRLAMVAEQDESVRTAAAEMLAGESWRGQEQAALLLAALDHKPAAPRLVELLESKRPEVMVATAWGLRRLALPETLPAIFDKARRQTEFRKSSGDVPGLDAQVAHLCEALGLMKYAPAEPVLREYIPKRQDWRLSRMAGIWALGHLHAGKPDEELAALLIARLTDGDPINPETQAARVSSALSLGRMLAVSQETAMRAWMGPEINPEPVDISIRWALIEMTGEELPPPLPPAGQLRTWFLEPLALPGQTGR